MRTTPKIPREFTEIPRGHLVLDAAQKISIEKMYMDGNDVTTHTFDAESEADQLSAASLLGTARLDIASRESASNKWAVR